MINIVREIFKPLFVISLGIGLAFSTKDAGDSHERSSKAMVEGGLSRSFNSITIEDGDNNMSRVPGKDDGIPQIILKSSSSNLPQTLQSMCA